MDQYGKGRLSVINEISSFCEKQIAALNHIKHNSQLPMQTGRIIRDGKIIKEAVHRASLTGQMSSYNRILQELQRKKNNLKTEKKAQG